MSFSKVTEQMRQGKGNVGQPDTPNVTTTEMQEIMDELANLAIDSFNTHIDELTANTAASNVGAQVPSGLTANENVQSILTVLSVSALDTASVKHSHANKTVLDSITESVKDGYDLLVNTLAGIESVQSAITDSNSAIPTSSAVVAYVAAQNIAQKVINAAYPVNSVYSTTSNLNPLSILGYGSWTKIGSTDSEGVSRYVRTA